MIENLDQQLLSAIQDGLPLVPRPYAAIGERLGIGEQQVIARLTALKQQGIIKRFGVIVKHRQLGYLANAMVVFDIPDALVEQLGQQIGGFDFINLCYRRPRRPDWPYNLYCMIHGKNRDTVLQQLQQLKSACGLTGYASEVLFSRRCFKQRGAIYQPVHQHGDSPLLSN